MNKLDEFLSKKNSRNVPGYTEEELNELLKQPELYQVCYCPVCGHKYLRPAALCLMCGFDENSDNADKIHKSYVDKISKNPNYIWFIDE